MMFGLPGIAAIYPRSASRHRRMLSSGMPSTRDRNSALSGQQRGDSTIRHTLAKPTRTSCALRSVFRSSAQYLVPRSKVASELQGYDLLQCENREM